MSWTVKFYPGVQKQLIEMPIGIAARMIKLLELIQLKGPNLGEPHTKPLGDKLFEVRAKSAEGIGRSLFCYQQDQTIIVLIVFIKKTEKTPKNIIELAKKRQKEIGYGDDKFK